MKQNSLKDRLMHGGLWSLVGLLLSTLSTLVVNALLARFLSPDALGAYFLVFSMVSLMVLVAQFGLPQAVVRLLAESVATNNMARAKAVTIKAIRITGVGVAIICVFLLVGGGQWVAQHILHSKVVLQAIALVPFWIVFLAFQNLLGEMFRGYHDIRSAIFFGGLLTSLLTAAVFIGFWVIEHRVDLNQVILVTIGCGMFGLSIAFIVLFATLKQVPWRPRAISSKEILRIAWPLGITAFTLFVLTQADVWVTGFFLGEDAVALYGAAVRLALLVMIPASLQYMFLPPIIAQMYVQSEVGKLEEILRVGAFLSSTVSIPLFCVFAIFAEPIMKLIYGTHYMQGKWLLVFLSFGLLFNVMTGIRGYVLMMTGKERFEMMISIGGAVLNIFLCSIGAMVGGINGVAAGAMIAMVVQCAAELIAVRVMLGVWTYASFSGVRGAIERLAG